LADSNAHNILNEMQQWLKRTNFLDSNAIPLILGHQINISAYSKSTRH